MGIELNQGQIYASYDLEHWWHRSTNQTFELVGAAGTGKAQPDDTIIPTPIGEKRLDELEVGDFVFNRLGQPVKILQIFPQGMKDVYKITLEDGRQSLCNDQHLWTMITSYGEFVTKTLEEMMSVDESEYSMYRIPNSSTVYYEEKKFNIDPYIQGSILANENNMRIPDEYFYGSISQRFSLIQGLFDTNGLISDNTFNIEYSSDNTELLNDIKKILRSLGYQSTSIDNTLYVRINNNEKYKLFKAKNKNDIALKCIDIPDEYDYSYTYIYNIEKMDFQVPMRCIYIDDPEHLYLTNDFIVTHNTSVIRYFIDAIGLEMDEVLFIAYMGKAVSQMIKYGLPAKTMHSACYTYEKEFVRDEETGKLVFDDKGKPLMKPSFRLKDKIGKGIKLIVIDEGYMIPEKNALDLLSFEIPTIILGDPNQLPPVFGSPFFLKSPDAKLTQIMRQKEGDPIVYLSQQVLAHKELKEGVYGTSAVINRRNLTRYQMEHSDVILTCTNKLRSQVNNLFREQFMGIRHLDFPNYKEKIICRKNNWSKSIDNGIFLTNGTSGFVDYVDKDTYNTKRHTIDIDFMPDFSKKIFRHLNIDLDALNAIPGSKDNLSYKIGSEMFEYAYAITVHLSQGSQYSNVLFLYDTNNRHNIEYDTAIKYTAITRAVDSLIFCKE